MTVFCIVWEFLFSSFLKISTGLVLRKALGCLAPSLRLFRDYCLALKSLVGTVGCSSSFEDSNLKTISEALLVTYLGF